MFKGLYNTVLGQIEAKENKKYITLYGINGKSLTDEITRVWKTTRITKYVFSDIGRLSVSFHKFFLIDIIYALEVISEEPIIRLSRRSILKAIDTLKELTDLRTVFKDNEYNSIVDRRNINLFNITPTDWQSQYLDIFSDRVQRYNLSGHLLDAEPGTGKTIGSLVLMECLKMDTIITVSPKNAVTQVWEDTLKSRYRRIPRYWSSTTNNPLIIGYEKYIVHYEALPSLLRFLDTNKNRLGKIGVIVDECLHPDTEVITPKGYRKITDITMDDLVLQYHSDGGNSWVYPSRIISRPTEEIHRYKNIHWEQIVTPNHRMIFKGSNGKLQELLSKDFHDFKDCEIYSLDRSEKTISLDISDTIKEIEYLDSPVDFYCLTVPTGMFYIRYNNKISVTGNCHHFNDEKSLRTQTLISICKNHATYSLFMSGTPLKAMGKETIPLLSSIDPIFDKDARDRYVSVFGMASDRALDILKNRMGIVSHKVKKDKEIIGDTKLFRYEAKVTLPHGKEFTIASIRKKMADYIEKRSKYYKDNFDIYKDDYFDGINYYREYIKNNPEELSQLDHYLKIVETIRKDYDPVEMKDDTVFCNGFEKRKILPVLPKDIKDRFRKAKSVYKYVKLTIMGECLGVVLGKERSRCNKDIALNLHNLTLKSIDNAPPLSISSLDDIINQSTKKTILFTSFVEVIKEVSSDLSSKGYIPAIVYGDTNKELNQILSRYDKDDTINPLIATFQSLSTAVPLIMANTIVMLNRPFREYEYKQAVARAWRKGQTEDVTIIDIYLDTGNEDNISTRSKDIAEEAAQIVAKIMGYDVKDIDISNESCTSCQKGSIFVDDNSHTNTNYIPIDNISNDPYTSEIYNDNKREDYYKTDKGFNLKTIIDSTDEDPVWDSDESKLILKDVQNETENPVSYHSKKNSYTQW